MPSGASRGSTSTGAAKWASGRARRTSRPARSSRKTFGSDACAMVAVEEVLEIERTVKADSRFQEALRRRGLIDDLDNMCVDPWTVGDFGDETHRGRRVLNCFIWMRHTSRSTITMPIRSRALHALIDLATLEILKVEDHFEAAGDYVPVPRMPLNYDADLLKTFRPPSSRLDVVQPDGAGYRVEGNRVTWENWDFRVGFSGRRRAGALHDRLYARRPAPPCRLPGVDRRARRALWHAASAATITRTSSTMAKSASAAWPIPSRSGATASASSIISTPWCRTCSARPGPSPTPSACTRKTPVSPGSISTCGASGPRCVARGAS